MPKLDGRIAVITGATSGIGLAAAQALAKQGAYVFLVGRRQDALDDAVSSIGAAQAQAIRADVTEQANDVMQAVPMVDQARANLDASGVEGANQAMLGDAGYYSEANVTGLERRGIEAYLATERLKHHEKVASAPRGRIPKGLSAKQRMARKLRTKTGRSMYAKRKGMIEPIFGQLKQVLGFRQFSMRGLASMRGEWRLMATVHNLLKLWRNDQRTPKIAEGNRLTLFGLVTPSRRK
jgi:hypothetical protein